MKNFLFYFLFLVIIKISFELVPNWNFQSSSIDLLNNPNKEFSYNVVDFELHSVKIRLNRAINIQDGEVKQKHTLFLDGIDFGETEFDDIESVYKNSENKYFVCPKGNFHVYIYKQNQGSSVFKPYDFPKVKNWNLLCFYQFGENHLFIAYLNNQINFYEYFLDTGDLKSKSINNGIHAFKWRISDVNIYKKPMIAIIKEGNSYFLKYIAFDIKANEEYNYYFNNNHYLTDEKSNFLAFFKKNSYNFFLISYNSVSDFVSGYYIKNEEITTDNIGSSEIPIIWNQSPLEFYDSASIEEMKFIYENKYVYYNIKNNNKDISYHGIIDVSLNKVIFNTDKEIIDFKPFSYSSMLAITKDSAYQICILKNGDNCVDECNYNNQIFDASNYNHCGEKCDTKYILKPNDICIEICDPSIYVIKNNNECWLCKDFGNEYIYKLVNYSECLKEKPQNSKDINPNLNIIACIDGYKYENGKCASGQCNENCKECIAYSEDNNNQKCISCKDSNLFLQEGNCVKKCSDNYFVNEKKCENCDISCKSCSKNSQNCTNCKEGYYMVKTSDSNKCEKCSTNCKTCKKGEEGEIKNCDSCNQESEFKYLFNKSCVLICPNNTFSSSKNVCIFNDDRETGRKDKDDTMLIIFIVISGTLLLIIIICFFKKFCWNQKKSSDRLLDEINKELIDNKEF